MAEVSFRGSMVGDAGFSNSVHDAATNDQCRVAKQTRLAVAFGAG